MENKYLTQSYAEMINKQSQKKMGSLNPMCGKSHSVTTKKKISDTQKERWKVIKQAIKEKSGETDVIARKDLLNQALNTDTISFTDVQQARNFIAIMTDKDRRLLENYLKSIVDKIIKNCIDTSSM